MRNRDDILRMWNAAAGEESDDNRDEKRGKTLEEKLAEARKKRSERLAEAFGHTESYPQSAASASQNMEESEAENGSAGNARATDAGNPQPGIESGQRLVGRDTQPAVPQQQMRQNVTADNGSAADSMPTLQPVTASDPAPQYLMRQVTDTATAAGASAQTNDAIAAVNAQPGGAQSAFSFNDEELRSEFDGQLAQSGTSIPGLKEGNYKHEDGTPVSYDEEYERFKTDVGKHAQEMADSLRGSMLMWNDSQKVAAIDKMYNSGKIPSYIPKTQLLSYVSNLTEEEKRTKVEKMAEMRRKAEAQGKVVARPAAHGQNAAQQKQGTQQTQTTVQEQDNKQNDENAATQESITDYRPVIDEKIENHDKTLKELSQEYRENYGNVKTKFAPENPYVLQGVVTKEALDKFPWLKGQAQIGDLIPYNKLTGEPIRQYYNKETGQAVESSELSRRMLHGENPDVGTETAALMLDNVNVMAFKMDDKVWMDDKANELLPYLYEQYMKEYPPEIYDDNSTYTYEGKQYTGKELNKLINERINSQLKEQAREIVYDNLNKTLTQARQDLVFASVSEVEDYVNNLYSNKVVPLTLSRKKLRQWLSNHSADEQREALRSHIQEDNVRLELVNRMIADIRQKQSGVQYTSMYPGSVVAQQQESVQKWLYAKEKLEYAINSERIALDALNSPYGINNSLIDGMKNSRIGLKDFMFGIPDLAESFTLSNTNEAMKSGRATKADYMLALSVTSDNYAQGLEDSYTGNQFKIGKGAVVSIPFMYDFLVGSAFVDWLTKGMVKGMATGWRLATASKPVKALEKLGQTALESKTGKKFLEFGEKFLNTKTGKITEWAAQKIKSGTGMVAEDFLNAFNMTGTVQVAKTGADVVNRMTGDMYLEGDRYRNYGTSLWNALYSGVMSSVVENYTEVAGERFNIFPRMMKAIAGTKYGRQLSLTTLGQWLSRLDRSTFMDIARSVNKRAKIGDVFSEGLEEEMGMILSPLLVRDGNSQFSDLWNPENQLQTWGTVALSCFGMGMFGYVTAGGKMAYDQALYHRHAAYLNKWAKKGAEVSGNSEKWTNLISDIEVTENKDMGLIMSQIQSSKELTAEQKKCAINYCLETMFLRGSNVGLAKAESLGVMDNRSKARAEAFERGRGAAQLDNRDIKADHEVNASALSQITGKSAEELDKMSYDEIDAMRGENDDLDDAISQYETSRAAYEGLLDKADEAGQQAGQQVEEGFAPIVDKDKGTIRKAKVHGMNSSEDHEVFIVKGNIAKKEDGTVDEKSSDKVIYYYNPQTGKTETGSAGMFTDIAEEQEAAPLIEKKKAEAKENATNAALSDIDGKVRVGSSFLGIDEGNQKHLYHVVSQNEDGTCVVTKDGKVVRNYAPTIAELQELRDLSDFARANERREQNIRLQQMAKRTEAREAEAARQASQPVTEEGTQNVEQQPEAPQQPQQYTEVPDTFDYSEVIDDQGEVTFCTVVDEDGRNLFPDAQGVYLVRGKRKGAATDYLKVAVIDADGNLHTENKRRSRVKVGGSMSLDEFKRMRQIELGNRYAIQQQHGGQQGGMESEKSDMHQPENVPEEKKGSIGRSLTKEEADELLSRMESDAEDSTEKELTTETWNATFDENNSIETPIGRVKMGENQIAKFFEKDRTKEFGMVGPTLSNPDVIIEEKSEAKDGGSERPSSFLFVKTFNRNGEKIKFFASVTVKQDGLEVSVSSHYLNKNKVRRAMQEGKVLYTREALLPNSSEWRLAEHQENDVPDLLPTQGNNASSDGKGSNNMSNPQVEGEVLTFRDGTPVPLDEDGEADFSQMSAEHIAEWYIDNLGADGKDVVDGKVDEAKAALDKAKAMKIDGGKPSELKASAEAKESAVKAAQEAYDKAKAVADSYAAVDARIEGETKEGRASILKRAMDKARRKMAKTDSVAEKSRIWNSEVTPVVNALYGGTSVEVNDLTPQTLEEYVASGIGPHSLNYEGKDYGNGMEGGLKQELGIKRGIGRNFDTNAFNYLLAKKGEGKTISELAHELWQDRPSSLEEYTDQDMRNALTDILTDAGSSSDILNYVLNNRVAQAEREIQGEAEALDNARYAAEHNAEETPSAPVGQENLPFTPASDDEAVPFSKSGETDRRKEPEYKYDHSTKQGRRRLIDETAIDESEIPDDVMSEPLRKAIHKIAETMGVRVQYLNTDDFGANGFVQDGVMYLSVSPEKTVPFVFGHEMTHKVREMSEDAYQNLKSLARSLVEPWEWHGRMAAVSRVYSNEAGYGTDDSFEEEVVADILGDTINDGNMLGRLATGLAMGERTRSERFKEKILGAVRAVKEFFNGVDYYERRIENVAKRIEQAYREAKTNVAGVSTQAAERGEETKLSKRSRKNKALETASVSQLEEHQPTVVSSADGAKVLQNLNNLASNYQKVSNQSKTFIGDLSQALDAKRHNSLSEYATFEVVNGKIVTIRLSNHNAKVSNFDNRGETDGISIVISPKENTGIINDGNAHLVEFFYDSIKLRRAQGKPLVEIVKSIKQALYSGEYNDKTGLAERQEVNVDEVRRFLGEQDEIKREDGGKISFSLRQKADPKKTVKVYKLMRLGEDGRSVQPLYIGSSEKMELGKWYDADSPALKDLKSLPSGAHLVDNTTGEAVSLDEFKEKHPELFTARTMRAAKPTKDAVDWATANNCRWISIVDKPKGQNRYGGESRSYYNYGINGSGAVGEFAMRPGWHAGSLPTMRQIGKGKEKNLRDDNFVWVEGEMPADIDYNAEAQKNADKDIPDHIPEDGYYLKSTNANAKAAQADKVGWYVGGSFKPVRIMSDAEADAIVDKWNGEHPDQEPVEKDWRRESGKVFNADTMRLEDAPQANFSLRLDEAKRMTETEPTEAQKESGNYRKGHVKFGGYDFTVENPAGSFRSGVDADGKEWRQRMHDTYGYIRGKWGKDGDHLDMFINDNADLDRWNGNVYVVDQVDKDGNFDEHKVMYGYGSEEEAKKAYLSNYEKGWTGLGAITGVSKAEFDRWLDSSKRKMKPFSEHSVAREAVKFSLPDNQKKEQLRKLRESKPAVITGEEIPYSPDLKQYKKNALEYGKRLRGTYTNDDTGEEIELTAGNQRGGLREILQHDYKDVEHLQSIAAIPQIIKKSVFVEELPNEDALKYPGVKSFRYYVCGLKIGKADYTVKAVVALQSNGDRYYDHKLTQIEKGKLLSIVPTIQKAGIENSLPDSEKGKLLGQIGQGADTGVLGTTPSTRLTNSSISLRKDKRLLSILQTNGEKNARLDAEYLQAVESGDMDKAQRMVNEAAERAGYNGDSGYQGTSAFNGAAPWGNAYFQTRQERKEAWDSGDYEGDTSLGDYIEEGIDGGNLEELTNAASYRSADSMRKEAIESVRRAVKGKSKTITMYRSVPADIKEGSFRNGDWVTPSREYAEDNAAIHGWGKDYRIIEQEVPVDDVWFDGNDIAEWGYGREQDYAEDRDFAYKNTENNRKSLEPVTYDDEGKVIPLSERFNEGNGDVRFSKRADTSERSVARETVRFALRQANDRFNSELDAFREKTHRGLMHLGAPSAVLRACGVGVGEITLSPKTLNRKLRQHSLSVGDVKDLVNAIQRPILVYRHGEKAPNVVVVTEAEVRGDKLSIALELDRDGNVVDLNNVSSIHGKDADTEVRRLLRLSPIGLKRALRWVEKDKVLGWLGSARLFSHMQTEDSQGLSLAKVINDFENPIVKDENFTDAEDGEASPRRRNAAARGEMGAVGNDVRFSKCEGANRSLVGVHNISEEKLLKALKLGGLANPSVAVIDSDRQKHSGYGEISLIMPSEKIAKRTGKNAGTFFGDAWTPTYPQVERQFGKGGSEKAARDIGSVPEEMQRMTRNAVDAWLDGRDADGLAYLYLKEKGKAPGLVRMEGKYGDKLHKAMKDITHGESLYKLDEETRKKVLDLMIGERYGSDRKAYDEDMARLARNQQEFLSQMKNPKALLARRIREDLEWRKEHGYDYDLLSKFVDEVNRDAKSAGEVSDSQTMLKAKETIEKDGLKQDFERWKDSLAERYGIKEVIFDGFTPSGNRRYVPNDLEHVSRIMKKKGLAGAEGSGFSFNQFCSLVMEKTGSLSALRKRKGMLTENHADMDVFTDEWGKVYNELADAMNPNPSGFLDDTGYYRLAEAALQRDPKAYAKREYGVDLTDKQVEGIHALVDAIRKERPAMYFETKFERPVGFDEFAAAVVPKNLSQTARQGLERAGVRLYDYDPSVEGDRKRAFDEATSENEERVKFSLPGSRRSAEAERRNAMNNAIDEAVSMVTGMSVREARDMRKANELRYKEDTKDLYDNILRGEYNDVTLRQLDEYISNYTPNNEYGRRISKRLPPRVERKVLKRERANIIDALYTRIAESSVRQAERELAATGSRRTEEETRRAVKETKQRLLKEWAIATGNWHTDISDFTDAKKPFGEGKDSDVYVSKDGNSVIKVSRGKEGTRFAPDLDDVALFNHVFPNSSYDIVGYGEIGGKFVRFLKQPLVDFSKREIVLRDALVERMRKAGMDVSMDAEKGQRVLDEANGKGKTQMGDAPETFGIRQKQAVEDRGVVMPNLNEASVKVVNDIPRHNYQGNIADATRKAIDAAKRKYVGKFQTYDNYGEKFDYTISGNAIEICLSPKHQAKSVNKGVHLALAEHIDKVIDNSIEVEEHPDYVKVDGKRDLAVNDNALMHRFYGVAVIDGKPYRVMTLMREDGRSEETNGIHSYEVQKIEMLDNELPSISNGVGTQIKEMSAYPLAKLLKGVEKAHDKGKYLLDESEKRSKDIREQRVYYNPRAYIAPVRGAWTKTKILRRLKDMGGCLKGVSVAARLISEFNSPEELYAHMFYHGTAHGYGALKPSITMSDREVERVGGGGYGEKYWGISVTKSKRIASRFSGSAHGVSIYPIILAKHAKVKEMPNLQDAADLEDYITDLWAEGVDAVWIGEKDKGEQELCVLNPKAIVNINSSDYYKAFGLGTEKNPLRIIDKEGVERLYISANRFVAAKKDRPRVPAKPSRFDDEFKKKPDAQYEKELSDYEDRMREYENSPEYKAWVEETRLAERNIRFFRTANGEAYGYAIGGKIYIDPRIADSETPIHEYAHLWGTALRNGNEKEWRNVVGLMKGTKIWDEVRSRYPELEGEDDIADEVVATYSGQRGAERLRKEMDAITSGNGGVFEKAEAVSALARVKNALRKFWRAVADFLHIHFTSAEEVADRVMKDLLDGVDPSVEGDRKRAFDEATSENEERVKFSLIGERGARSLDHAEEVTVRMDNLDIARQMEEAEKDAKAIKMATGWERGADGKWRYEIPDIVYHPNGDAGYKTAHGRQPWSKELDSLTDRILDGEELSKDENARFEDLAEQERKFKNEYMSREKPSLADWVEAKDLLSSYPELKRMEVVFTDKLPKNTGGYYSSKDNRIVVNTAYEGDIESVLAHEIQHAIQRKEGFATGGNMESQAQYRDYLHSKQRWLQHPDEIMDAQKELRTKAWELRKRIPWDGKEDTEFKKAYEALQKEVYAKYPIYKEYNDYLASKEHKDVTDITEYEFYKRLGGEVEARNVQKRMGMSPEERRRSLAADTEDVAREDQIFLYGDGTAAMSFGEPYDYERYPRGKTEPGLAEKRVKIVEADAEHGFKNYREAKEWGLQNLCRIYSNDETGGKGEFEITPAVMNKYVSEAAREKSISEKAHYAVLRALPEILRESIDTETHPNFLSHGKNKNDEDLRYDKNMLVHILYGAVRIGDELCRVKITAKEYPHIASRPYSYEVQDIETEIEPLNPIDGKARSTDREFNNSISGAKLLKDVEMSYEKGKKLLDESKKNSIGTSPRRRNAAAQGEEAAGKGTGEGTRFSLRNQNDNYEQRLAEWKEKNGLDADAEPMERPVYDGVESANDFMDRMVEWTRNKNLWKTAPKPMGYWEALEQWKQEHGIAADEFPPTKPRRQDFETEEKFDKAMDEYKRDLEKWQRPVAPNEADFKSEEEYRAALDKYREEVNSWTEPPRATDYDLAYDVNDINNRFEALRKAVTNQRMYDQRTVSAVTDLIREMIALGWGDNMGRGTVKRLLSAVKNVTGQDNVRKWIDKAMGILTDNYLSTLKKEYQKILDIKASRLDQSGIVKIGSLDVIGQGYLKEYKRALEASEEDNGRRATALEEDSFRNPSHKDANDAMIDGIQAASRYRETIGSTQNDISDLQDIVNELSDYNANNKHSTDPAVKEKIKQNREIIRSATESIEEHKAQLIKMYNDHLDMMNGALVDSKDRAREFREAVKERRLKVLQLADADMEGRDASNYTEDTMSRKFFNSWPMKIVTSSTYTFEQYLKLFGYIHNATGEGYLYNHFMPSWLNAINEQQIYMEEHRKTLDAKASEIFGKGTKFSDLIGITGKKFPGMDIEVVDEGNPNQKRRVHLTQGQMLYIYLVSKQTDGRMKLAAQGIYDDDVNAMTERIDPRLRQLGEWIQDEYLPQNRQRYQETHTKFFGAPMREVDHYFPIKVNQRARYQNEDVAKDSQAASQLVSTATGAIVTRRVNTLPLDIENTDAFAAVMDNLASMEEWSAMLPFRQDINTLLSSTKFRNQVHNMSSMAYGSQERLWNQFKQCAQIAAGTYKARTDSQSLDKAFLKTFGLVSMAKISWRFWTAFKQTLSAPAFLTEADPWRFTKNGMNPYGSYKWAYENLPIFRRRVESMAVGDTRIKALLDDMEKTNNILVSIGNKGMLPNVFVDAVTCAVGARSVYETELARLKRLGYTEEQAQRKAMDKAAISYNRSQQSSEGAFVSPMQVDRTYLTAVLSLFKNSPYSYGRNIIDAVRGLSRTMPMWNNNKSLAIESMKRRVMEQDGIEDEATARRIAEKAYKRTRWKSIATIVNYFTVMPILWNLGSNVLYCLMGDDDDKKKDMLLDAAIKGTATTVSDDYVIPFVSDMINSSISVENGEVTFDPKSIGNTNLYKNPATSDIASMIGNFSNGNFLALLNKFGNIGVQAMTGFNPQTLGNALEIWSEWDGKGDTPTEMKIALMKLLNSPEDNIRNLMMDELGLNRKEASKMTVAELERRYAERRVNRENGLTRYLMKSGDYDKLVDKYAKQFEERIKANIDRLDEHDRKKTDRIYDSTLDPKIREMISKKRDADTQKRLDEEFGKSEGKKKDSEWERVYKSVSRSSDLEADGQMKYKEQRLKRRWKALEDEYNSIEDEGGKSDWLYDHPRYEDYLYDMKDAASVKKEMRDLMKELPTSDDRNALMNEIRSLRQEYMQMLDEIAKKK